MTEYTAPASIVIVGSGVFGLTTALSLSLRPKFCNTKITIVDKSPFPSTDGASIDSSRLILTDYHEPLYHTLAKEARKFWRGQDPSTSAFGGELGTSAHYRDSPLVVIADDVGGVEAIAEDANDVRENVGQKVQRLVGNDAIKAVCGLYGVGGEGGYVNHDCGWANAEAGMRFLHRKVKERPNVRFLTAEVISLVYVEDGKQVIGVWTKKGGVLQAELTILATGAWTPGLINVGNLLVSTSTAMASVVLSEAQQEEYSHIPIIRNSTTGVCIVPPRDRNLKIYRYFSDTRPGEAFSPNVSAPSQSSGISQEDKVVLRRGLRNILPSLGSTTFLKTRTCWNTDTPTRDFLVTYHPRVKGLFLAAGGHAYKFLPVLGDEVVDIIEGLQKARFKYLWRWRDLNTEGPWGWVGLRRGRNEKAHLRDALSACAC